MCCLGDIRDIKVFSVFYSGHIQHKKFLLISNRFKQYQEAFYSCSPVTSESNLRGPLLLYKLVKHFNKFKSLHFSDDFLKCWAHFFCGLLQKTNAWTAFSSFIRSVTKFLSALEDRDFRSEFEDYLIHDYKHFSQRKSLCGSSVHCRGHQINQNPFQGFCWS